VQIGSNPFIGSLQKSTIELDRKKAQDRKTSKYSVSYILDLSANAMRVLKLFEKEKDYYPIINTDVFAYKKNLDLEYKIHT
jgi:hypothetical protein